MSNPDITKLGVIQDDDAYFSHPAYGHSTLVKFERDGFKAIAHLHDPLDTPSIQFGKIVDCMMTEGMSEFHKKYHMKSTNYATDSDQYLIAKKLYDEFGSGKWEDITYEDRIAARNDLDAWKNLKVEATILRKMEDNCKPIFEELQKSNGKTLCSWEDYNSAKACREALLAEPSTAYFFQGDDGIERHHQLQFFATIDGVEVKCKPDMLLVDHKLKRVIMGDLKTTSFPEYEFYRPFVQMGYMCQAVLYSRILRHLMDQDKDFKDYKLMPFFFVPINRETLTPILFFTNKNLESGDIKVGKVTFKDPIEVAKELDYYIKQNDIKTPKYILQHKSNSLDSLIEDLY